MEMPVKVCQSSHNVHHFECVHNAKRPPSAEEFLNTAQDTTTHAPAAGSRTRLYEY